MDKINFKKLGLICALEKLSNEIMRIQPYINDEVGIENFDYAITTLDLIIKGVKENE